MACPIVAELCRDAGCKVPMHLDSHAESLGRMLRLVDWLARYLCPKILVHDDGRPIYPKHAELLKGLKPVRDEATCRAAAKLAEGIIGEIGDERDCSMSVVMRHLHFMGTMTAEALIGRAPLGAYGIMGIFEVALHLGIPIDGEFNGVMNWVLAQKKAG